MRTLKRTLCLVLALVMVLGLGVNAFAFDKTADDFPDKDDSVHDEALAVLTAIGIVVGDNEGMLNAKENVTRREAAILMTKLLGDANLDNQVLPSSFDDVKGHWGEQYIAYLEGAGIVTGYPDGLFHPNDNVTGYELGSMVLRVLGYDADAEGFTTGAWGINVLRTMTNQWARLTHDLDVREYNDPLIRDDAIQMMFNALVATKVYYPNGVRTRVDVAAAGETIGYKDYRVDTTGSPAADADFYIQLCEDSYPLLTLDGGAVDGFNRPGRTWSYNRAPIIFIANTPIAVYHSGELTGAKAKTYADAIAKGTKVAPNIYYNGSAFAGSFQAATNPANPTTAPNGLWVDDKTGIPGYEIEIYATPGNELNQWDVIVREAYLARIDNISDTTGDITLEVYEQSKLGETTPNVVAPFAFTVKAPTDKTAGDDVYAELKGYMEGEYLAVYLTQGWAENYIDGTSDPDDFILETAKLTSVETSIKHIYDNGAKVNSTLETDKGTFQVNNEAMWSDDAFETVPTVKVPGFNNSLTGRNIHLKEVVLYTLDGTVLLAYQAANTIKTTGYAYLWDTLDEDPSGWVTSQGAAVHKVRLILDTDEDGTYSINDTDAFTEVSASYWDHQRGREYENVEDATKRGGPYNVDNGGVLVYYVREGAVYQLQIADLKAPNSVDRHTNAHRSPDATPSDLGEDLVVNGIAQGQLPEATTGDLQRVVYDNATKFYVVTGSGTETKNETIKVYTGIKNVPSQVLGERTEVQYVFRINDKAMSPDDRTGTNITNLVDYVVIKNAGYTRPEGTYFIVGGPNVTYHSVLLDSGVERHYYGYMAVVDHERVARVYVSNMINGTTPPVIARTDLQYDEDLVNYSVLNNRAYIASNSVETAVFKDIPVGPGLGLQDVKNGVIVLNNVQGGTDTRSSYSLANVPIYLYNTSNGTVQTVNYSRVPAGATGYYVMNAKNDAVVALYVNVT